MVLYVARHAACEHRNMAISWLLMTIYSISGYILAINSTSECIFMAISDYKLSTYSLSGYILTISGYILAIYSISSYLQEI